MSSLSTKPSHGPTTIPHAPSTSPTPSTTISEQELERRKDTCLTNLKILSKIKQGDKLLYNNSTFVIDAWTYTQPLYRWYYAESRNTTIRNLEDFTDTLLNTIDIIYTNEFQQPSLDSIYYTKVLPTAIPAFKEGNSNILLTFVSDMRNAMEGLSNLKQTYRNDISTVSAIDVLIEKINIRIKKISSILSIDRPSAPISTSSTGLSTMTSDPIFKRNVVKTE